MHEKKEHGEGEGEKTAWKKNRAEEREERSFFFLREVIFGEKMEEVG